MKDFRSDLSDELSVLAQPPLGDVVGAAARGGRRARRVRAIGKVAGSAAALAGVAVLLSGSLNAAGRSPVPVAAAVAPSLSPAAPGASGTPTSVPTTAPFASSAPGTVPTTGAALLSSLLRILPQDAKTSGYGGQNAEGVDFTMAQTYLTTPAGTGMVRAFLHARSTDAVCTEATGCFRDHRGQQVFIQHVADNCIQHTVVWVIHPDGTEVELALSNCLAWDGHANKPGILALTEDQAVAVAGDPSLDRFSTPAAVTAAAAQFPSLPRIG